MYFEGKISENFSEFSTIFETISSTEYSDEQKEEMMELLKAQTIEKHLYIIRTFCKMKDDTSELSDIVWEVVEERGKGNFASQEVFLKLFDAALEVHEDSNPNERKMFGDSLDHNSSLRVQRVQEDLKRKNDYLMDENRVLKEELDEKMVLLDNLSQANRNLSILKSELHRIEEKCAFLDNENSSLKAELNKVKEELEVREVEFSSRENKMLNDIKEMKESVAVKDSLLKLSEKERGFMFTDFELLSDEIVDRDLVIQSLSEPSEQKETFFEHAANALKEEDFDHSFRKAAPTCENCARRRESSVYFSQLNSTIPRRRGTPSPVFDDSFSSFSQMPEVVDFSQRRTKSLSDELMEVKVDMEEDRTIALREILGTLFLLEVDLRSRRQKLEKSVRSLLKKKRLNPNPNLMVRYRVVKGEMTKMQFTRYEGVRLPN